MGWTTFWGSRSWIRACLCKNLFLQSIMAIEKEPGGSEENGELTSGNWYSLDSSTDRKIKSQPSRGSWQLKDSDLSRVGGTWKGACVPWSGLAECWLSFPSVCFVLDSILFPTAIIILVARHVTWQGSSESQKSEHREVNEGREGVNSGMAHSGPQWKGDGEPCRQAAWWVL